MSREWYIIPNGIKWAGRFNQAKTFDEYMELANEANAIQSTTGISSSKKSRKIEMRVPQLGDIDKLLTVLNAFSRFFFKLSELDAKYATVDEDDNLYTFQWQLMEDEEAGELFVQAYNEIQTSKPSDMLVILKVSNSSTVGAYTGVAIDYLEYLKKNPVWAEPAIRTKEDVAYYVAWKMYTGWDHIMNMAKFEYRDDEHPMEKEPFLRFLGWKKGSERPENSYYLAYIMKHRFEPTVVPLVKYLVGYLGWITMEEIIAEDKKRREGVATAFASVMDVPRLAKGQSVKSLPTDVIRRLERFGL